MCTGQEGGGWEGRKKGHIGGGLGKYSIRGVDWPKREARKE